MCNYKYTHRHKHRTIGKKFPYSELYRDLRERKVTGFDFTLPMDKHGRCIFHSNELEWKRENNFTQKIIDLINILDACNDIDEYDFAEFVFVGEKINTKRTGKYYSLNF